MTLPSVKSVILIGGPSNFNNPEAGPPCVFEEARSSASTQIATAGRNEAADAMSQNEIVQQDVNDISEAIWISRLQ